MFRIRRIIITGASIFVLLGAACSPNQSSANSVIPDNAYIVDIEFNEADDCVEWSRQFSILSDSGKQNVRTEGISIGAHDDLAATGYYVIGENLVRDCGNRLFIGKFIRAAVEGTDNEKDRDSARNISDEIVMVLGHIWNSSAFSVDGVSHEKYLLLVNSGISDDAIAPFIRRIIKNESFSSDLQFVSIQRPILSLSSALSQKLDFYRRERDVPRQIVLTIALQLSSGKNYMSHLRYLSRNRSISNVTKLGLLSIIKKFKNGEKVSNLDIESLGLPVED